MAPSMERWSRKVAVVIGASSIIGSCIAEHLYVRGLKVFGFRRRQDSIGNVSFHVMQVDLTKTDDIVRAFDEIYQECGPVQILVNCAGLLPTNTLCDGDVERWRETFEVNVIGPCTATKQVVAQMRKHKVEGHIIYMNCFSGHMPSDILGENVYPASKYAVTALTNSWRHELMEYDTKIRVTSISLKTVKSKESARRNFIRFGLLDSRNRYIAKDISEAVLYVLSTPSHVQVHELMLGCDYGNA